MLSSKLKFNKSQFIPLLLGFTISSMTGFYALKVLYKIKKKHKNDEMILKMIAETNQYDNNEESLIHYKELVKMKPDNITYLIEISRIYHIDRGYEKIENKLNPCGANIKRKS